MNKLRYWLILFSRVLVGIVFIYSGFVKGVDPLGSTYKFTDYFEAFGTSWANNLSFMLSVIQSMAEFVIGISLVLNLRIKLSSLGALIFMAIFTPLTFYIAIANPVHDCGCFGDALIITNWQTFWKNLVLLVPIIYLFKNRNTITSALSINEQWYGVVFFTIAIGLIINYSYMHLPIKDFRPYKIGANIPDGMVIPNGAPADEYKSIFIYKKDDIEQEFEINNLPDSTWTFVDAQHKRIKKGYTPPIHDFTIASIDRIDVTDIVLNSATYNFLFVSYNIEKALIKNTDKINKLVDYCSEMGYPFIGLTASNNDKVSNYIKKTNATFDFYNTDEITLKTIVRSNPGIVVIKDGTIINKWHINDIPEIAELQNDLTSQSIKRSHKKATTYLIYIMILATALVSCIYMLIRKKIITE